MRRPLRAGIAASAAAATLTALAACAPPADESGPRSLTMGISETAYGFIGSPLANLNLLYFHGSASYEPLIEFDPVTGELAPWLAESWTLSEDRKTLTLQLRDDVDYIDGEHLDAQAIADYFAIYLESENPEAGLMGGFYGLQAAVVDEYTVEITTTQAMGTDFFYRFRNLGMASPVAAQDPEGLKTQAAGTGPYLVDEEVTGVSISYVRNPDYWNPDAYEFDTLTYQVFADNVAALNALRAGQIDVADVLEKSVAADLESNDLKIVEGAGLYTTIMVTDFAGEVVPALADQRVRQAIAMVFDQQAIVDSLEGGFGSVSDQVFGSFQPLYLDGEDDRYPYDVEAAKELMAEAGYADGFDLVIPGSANAGFYPDTYEPIVQQSLAEIGIRVTYTPFPDAGTLLAEWGTRTYGAILVQPNYEDTMSIIEGDPPLIGHYGEDPTYAELSAAIKGGTIAEAEAASAELGEFFLDQAWFIPLTHNPQLQAMNPDVDYPVTIMTDARLDYYKPSDG